MTIEIRNITKRYGDQKALDDVSLTVGEGQVVGLLGPNGAGKSTLMKVMTGYVRPDHGHVRLCGHDIEREPMVVKQLVGYLPEHNPLYLDMYVSEYLSMVAGMYGIRNRQQRADELIEMTGLAPEAHKKIGALSKGYRQRVGLSQALVGDPQVVILDEPTTGLDPNQIIEIRELIRGLARERTVILSTHIMQEVEAVCDQIVIIDHGKIRAQGTTAQVRRLCQCGQTVLATFVRPIDTTRLATATGATVEQTDTTTYRLTSKNNNDLRLEIFNFAVGEAVALLHLAAEKGDIEELFHRLTATTTTTNKSE